MMYFALLSFTSARSAKAAGEDKPCGNLSTWLFIQAVLMFLQVAMAIYLFRRMSKPYDRSNKHDRDFVARMSYLICEDIGVALYILVLIAVVVWCVQLLLDGATHPLALHHTNVRPFAGKLWVSFGCPRSRRVTRAPARPCWCAASCNPSCGLCYSLAPS